MGLPEHPHFPRLMWGITEIISGFHSGWRKITGHLSDYYPPRPPLFLAPNTSCAHGEVGAPSQMPEPTSRRSPRCRARTGLPCALHPASVHPPRQLQAQDPGPTGFTSARIPPASPPRAPWQRCFRNPTSAALLPPLRTFLGRRSPLARSGRGRLRLGGVVPRQGAGPRSASRSHQRAVPSPGWVRDSPGKSSGENDVKSGVPRMSVPGGPQRPNTRPFHYRIFADHRVTDR